MFIGLMLLGTAASDPEEIRARRWDLSKARNGSRDHQPRRHDRDRLDQTAVERKDQRLPQKQQAKSRRTWPAPDLARALPYCGRYSTKPTRPAVLPLK